MSKTNKLEGFRVFVSEYFDGCQNYYSEKIEEMGGEVIWGRPFSQTTNAFTEEELIKQCKDIDGIIIIARDILTKAVFDASPKLRIISKQGIGLDKVPLDLAAEYGILVTNTALTVVNTVAEHAFCLIIASLRKLPQVVNVVKEGQWRLPNFNFRELSNKTVGLIGFGNIGKALTKKLTGWDCNILVYDPFIRKEEIESIHGRKVELEKLLQESDIISLNVPLLDSTREMIGDKEFDLMKSNAIIVNTSRGKIIDEEAMIRALQNKKIAGAALDVTYNEPINFDNPLIRMENVIITPHVAGSSEESWIRTAKQSAKNCMDALMGEKPEFLVNAQGFKKWQERFLI